MRHFFSAFLIKNKDKKNYLKVLCYKAAERCQAMTRGLPAAGRHGGEWPRASATNGRLICREPERAASRGGGESKGGGSRSISRVLSWATIPLGASLPARSSGLPGSSASHAIRFPIWPCFRWGLPCRPCYHVRGELLPRPNFRPTAPAIAGAPFHPCLYRQNKLPCST